MDKSVEIPPVLKDILSRIEVGDVLSEEDFISFFEVIGEQESFLPELVCVVGLETFMSLVSVLGGTTIKIPEMQEISRAVKRYSREGKNE